MPVHVEKQGPVTTVILDRPEVRNAVDRVAAQALADAFGAFERIPRPASRSSGAAADLLLGRPI